MLSLKKLILLLFISLAVIVSLPFQTEASPLVYTTQRIAGQDQVETAIKISQQGWTSAQTVILCQYADFPDSIAATPFAVSLNAPILLTKGDTIDPRVVSELQRLKPQKVILLGGAAVLQPSIEDQLNKLSLKWERIGGTDRYETSTLLAKRLTSDSLILANGDNFPDALSAATYAGIKQIPIVLTSTKLPDSVIKYYQETKPQHLIVIGGEVVVPSNELAKNNFNIETRLGGQDLYETNAKVVSYALNTYSSNNIFLASGITFPDAVAGTVLASKEKAPLLLTEKDDIPPAVYTLMRNHMKVEPPSPQSSSQPSENVHINQQGVITSTGGLNFRDTPSSTGNVICTIPTGTTIDILDQQGQWYKTTYQSKTGWVSAEYVSIKPTPQVKKGKITSALGLNLRDNPASTGKALITIPKDTLIDIAGQQGNWYKTTYQTFTGWVSADYISLVSVSTTTSTTTTTTSSATAIDLSPNGTVYILGGTGIISTKAQGIIEGKASSAYADNLKTFAPLPAEIKKPDPPSSGSDPTPPVPATYDPSKEVLINPFAGIPANALAGKTIVVDPGHGGPDTGAIGPNHSYEKTNTLAISLDLNDILKQAGAKVILTRNMDISPATGTYSEVSDLQARVDIANQAKADLFICIHNDSYSNPAIQGTSTYYYSNNSSSNKSLQLANSIQSAVIDTVKTNNRGVKEANYYVLNHTTMPAILLEAAFISSPYEEARLQNPTFQKDLAAAIFRGIYNYYTTPLPVD